MELTDQLTAYGAIFSMAVAPIWIGAHLSLQQRGAETMSSEDAWKFPFIGSGVLFGLYMLFKMFSKEYINLLLTGYFLIFGVLAVTATLKPLFVPILSSKEKAKKYSWKPFWKSNEPFELEVTTADIAAFVVSTAVGIWYVMTKHWISNNILGLSFSIQGVAMLALGSYKVGAILLGGLFFYDIFWVFGTDVMVTVAKSFDAPIKLLFPNQLAAATLEFSMLGLGDIVIPGVFIALLLRFDVHRCKGKKAVSKLYFYTCYISYFAGLVTTIAVMHIFKAAQPALLYLVPSTLIPLLVLGWWRGELPELWNGTGMQQNEEPKHTN